MEKMKRRSTWMRIMAVMLAMATGITMMPLDTMAATEKDSGAYVLTGETYTNELIADETCDATALEYSNDDSDTAVLNGENDSVIRDGTGETSTDLHFDPYEYGTDHVGTGDFSYNGAKYCQIIGNQDYEPRSFLTNFKLCLSGEEKLPEGVEPSYISLTKLQWSPGLTFDTAKAHDLSTDIQYNKVEWVNQASRLAGVFYGNYYNAIPEMEVAGLHNNDPFTVRATQSWEGGEYTFDYTFKDGLREKLELEVTYWEGLDTPPVGLSKYIRKAGRDILKPQIKRSSDKYEVTFSYLQRKDVEFGGLIDPNDTLKWNNYVDVCCVKARNVFTGRTVYNNRGTIGTFAYDRNICYHVGFSRDGSYESETFDRYAGTCTFEEGETVSIICFLQTSVGGFGTYYHSPAWAFNYTFGDPIPSFEDRQLIVNYVLAEGVTLPDGASLPTQYKETVAEGLTYKVETPEITGLVPDQKVVEGTMGASDVTVTVTYGKNHIATPPTAKTGLVYNAETQTGVEAGTGYTLTGNTGKDAGDYTARARLQEGYTWTDGTTDTKTIAWSIAPAELTEVTLTETVFYYNGEVQRPDVTEVKAGDLIVPETDYTVVYEGGDTKDPGTYRVLVRKEFDKNNVTGNVWATYEIKDGIVPPTAKIGLAYNGREQTGVEPGEGYTLTGNTGMDAGSYKAKAILDSGNVWRDGTTDDKEINWSIEPAEIIVLTLTETSFVYDGDVHVPSIKEIGTKDLLVATNDYTVEWSDKNSKEVGVYTITVKGFGNLTGTVTATYAITTEVTPPTAKTDLEYTGKEQTGVDAGKGYTIKGNTATDAGDYKAIATLDPGYTWTDGTTTDKEISWSIAPAELSYVTLSKSLYFYDGNVHKPEVNSVNAGELKVPSADYSLSWSNENSKDVGFYTVEATATTNNFAGTATATYEISDGIADVPTAKALVYNGTKQTGVEPGTGYTLWNNTGESAGNYIATATLEEGFVWRDGSKAQKTIPWSIERAPITSIVLSERSFIYDGSVHKPRIISVYAGRLLVEIGDYTLEWSDENSKDVGSYKVTARGTNNFTGVTSKWYVIESMEAWNLFEDGSAHVYTVNGVTSKNEVTNSNKSSAKYFNSVLSKDKITVSLKEGADRKKAAGTNVFDFDLGDEGAVSYTLPFTYDKPVLKLSSTKGTVKKGIETTLNTTVLVQTENGNYVPYDLTGATVTYGNNTVTTGNDGQVSIKASAKASNKLVISKPGWNDKDPVQLNYTISEVKADKDVLELDMGGLKEVTLSKKAPEQSFTFPLSLNGEAATAATVSVETGKKGEENLVSIGNGTLTVSLGRSGIGKGSYTVKLKAGTAKISVKVRVTEKAYTATGKIKQKYDVVTQKPMIIEPALKELSGTIINVAVSKVEPKKGGTSIPASSFEAVMNNGNIEVTYTGAEEMKASNLKIGDMTFTLTVTDSSAGGNQVDVTMLVKNVSAKKTTPTVKAAKVVIPKAIAENADGTTVIGTANILSNYKDSAKHTQMITPVSVKLDPKSVVAEVDPEDQSRILIKKLNGSSGSVKATLTYPGGVTKTVTIKVSKGK